MAKKTTKAPDHWSVRNTAEKLDPTPIEQPIGYHQPKPLAQIMREFVRQELATRPDDEVETFEEANDFVVPPSEEDLLDMSPYQFTDTDPEWPDIPPVDPEEAPAPETPLEAPERENPEQVGDSAEPNEEDAGQASG